MYTGDALQSVPDHIPDLHYDLYHVDDVHHQSQQHRLQDRDNHVEEILRGQSQCSGDKSLSH